MQYMNVVHFVRSYTEAFKVEYGQQVFQAWIYGSARSLQSC